MSGVGEKTESQFPGKASAFVEWLQTVLTGLHLLSKDDERAPDDDSKTPPSYQLIRSGALSFSKDATKLAKWASGAGLVSMATGLGTWLNGAHPTTQASLVLGGSGIIIAALVSLAMIVRADVGARGIAAAARYEARADVIAQYIGAIEDSAAGRAKLSATDGKQSTNDAQDVAALLVNAFGAGKQVKVNLVSDEGDDAHSVRGIRDAVGKKPIIELDKGEVPLADVRGFHATFVG